MLAIPSPQNRPHLVCDHPHDPEGSTTMSNIDPTIETAVLEDFRRHILGAEDSVAGAKYVYELTRLLYNEAKFGAYAPSLRTALGLVVDAAGSAHLTEYARTGSPSQPCDR